jgi:hypothetical protein
MHRTEQHSRQPAGPASAASPQPPHTGARVRVPEAAHLLQRRRATFAAHPSRPHAPHREVRADGPQTDTLTPCTHSPTPRGERQPPRQRLAHTKPKRDDASSSEGARGRRSCDTHTQFSHCGRRWNAESMPATHNSNVTTHLAPPPCRRREAGSGARPKMQHSMPTWLRRPAPLITSAVQ